jgi:hypothetical protein
MNRVTLQSNDNAAEGVLYMAMESGDKRWKLVFSDGGAKRRHETVEAGRRMQLVEAGSVLILLDQVVFTHANS